jgi:hypothetical protein
MLKSLINAWHSPAGLCIHAELCERCKTHYRVVVFPATREYVGGKKDGTTTFHRFIFDINKFVKCFDKRPFAVFDTAKHKSSYCPFVAIRGIFQGFKCEVYITSTPPKDARPNEREYCFGPKKGQIEPINDDDER